MEKNNVKETKLKIALCFALVFFIAVLYFSYKINIYSFVFSQKIATYLVLFGVTILSYFTILYLYEKKNTKIENVFLVVAMIFCFLMYLAMPITKAHDEPIHGYRIYEYVSGKLTNNGKSVTLSEGIIETLNNKPSYQDIFLHEKSYSTQMPQMNYEYRMSNYSPVSYLPHLIGIYTSSLLTDNAMIQVYIARLCNMIACITMLYFAIKMIPFGKNMLFLISLIPIAIEGYISLSADGIAICSSILLISYVLKLRQEEKTIGYQQIIILTILSIVVALAKIVYLPLVLLICILPKERFYKNRKWKVVFGIFAISALLDASWYLFGTQASTQENVEAMGNPIVFSILTQPLSYLSKIVYTILTRFSNYFNELFGGKLEYNENISIPIFPYFIFLCLFFITRSKNKSQRFYFSTVEKTIFLVIIFSVMMLIFTAMNMGWSRPNIAYIEGVQGRYFLPILPLSILLFAKGFSDEEKITKRLALLITIMQIFVICEIFVLHI